MGNQVGGDRVHTRAGGVNNKDNTGVNTTQKKLPKTSYYKWNYCYTSGTDVKAAPSKRLAWLGVIMKNSTISDL